MGESRTREIVRKAHRDESGLTLDVNKGQRSTRHSRCFPSSVDDPPERRHRYGTRICLEAIYKQLACLLAYYVCLYLQMIIHEFLNLATTISTFSAHPVASRTPSVIYRGFVWFFRDSPPGSSYSKTISPKDLLTSSNRYSRGTDFQILDHVYSVLVALYDIMSRGPFVLVVLHTSLSFSKCNSLPEH